MAQWADGPQIIGPGRAGPILRVKFGPKWALMGRQKTGPDWAKMGRAAAQSTAILDINSYKDGGIRQIPLWGEANMGRDLVMLIVLMLK